MIILSKIEVRKDDIVYCVYADESVLPNKDEIRAIRAAGYKLYKDGRLYKPESKTIQN